MHSKDMIFLYLCEECKHWCTMKRLFTILALAATLLLATGCAGGGGFKVTSCSVGSITPSGLKAMKAVLKIGIINPISKMTITDVNGVINNDGREFATFKAGKLPLLRSRQEQVYPLSCSGAIARDVGLMDLLKLASSQDFSGMTIDLAVKVRLFLGIKKTFRFNDLKVTDLMEPSVAATYVELLINENII